LNQFAVRLRDFTKVFFLQAIALTRKSLLDV